MKGMLPKIINILFNFYIRILKKPIESLCVEIPSCNSCHSVITVKIVMRKSNKKNHKIMLELHKLKL